MRTLQPPRPVVFCSGAAYEADHQRAMEAGAQAYLDKPFEIDCLLETVQRLIGAQ